MNNPPAFPQPHFDSFGHANDPLEHAEHPGMTLRDWFAGQAIGAVIAEMQGGRIGDHPGAGGGPNGFAATAYDIADAMLAARSKDTPA